MVDTAGDSAVRHKQYSRWVPRTRRQWTMFTAGAAAVMLVAYVAYSFLAWQSIAARSAILSQQFQEKTQSVMTTLRTSDASVDDKRAALHRLVESVDGACVVPTGIAWQEQLLSLGKYRAACERVQERYQQVTRAGQAVERYFADEQQLVKVLQSRSATPKTVAEKDWPGQLAAWRQTDEALRTTSVGSAAEPVKKSAVVATGKVVVAWQALLDAHAKQDMTAFHVAKISLQDAYDLFGDTVTAGEAALRPLVATLEDALP